MEYDIRENMISGMCRDSSSELNIQLFQYLRRECLKLFVFHPEYLSEETRGVIFEAIQVGLSSDAIRVIHSVELEEKNYPFSYLSLTSKEDSNRTVYLIPNGAERIVQEMARENELFGVSQPCSHSADIPKSFRESSQAASCAFCLDHSFQIYQNPELAEHEGLKTLAAHFSSQLSTDRYTSAFKQLKSYLFDVQHGKISSIQFMEAIETIRVSVTVAYGRLVPEGKRELVYQGLTRSSQLMQKLEEWLETYHTYILQDMEVNQKIQKAIDYMKEHYTENLNMALVSNYVSINYSLFSVEFKKYTGENFVSYLKKIRIEEAKRLLEDSNLKIAPLALKAGFHDEKHFMKVFRAETGVTPSEYRKSRELNQQ